MRYERKKKGARFGLSVQYTYFNLIGGELPGHAHLERHGVVLDVDVLRARETGAFAIREQQTELSQ